jgi:hypothetical protein
MIDFLPTGQVDYHGPGFRFRRDAAILANFTPARLLPKSIPFRPN